MSGHHPWPPPAREVFGMPVVESEMVPPGTIYVMRGQVVAPREVIAQITNLDRMPAMPANTESTYQSVRDFLRRNAVVILPFLVTVWQATDGLTLKDAVPVVVGLVLRQFFTSPTFEVEQEREQGLVVIEQAQADAFAAGKVLGKVLGQPRDPELDELEHPFDGD